MKTGAVRASGYENESEGSSTQRRKRNNGQPRLGSVGVEPTSTCPYSPANSGGSHRWTDKSRLVRAPAR